LTDEIKPWSGHRGHATQLSILAMSSSSRNKSVQSCFKLTLTDCTISPSPCCLLPLTLLKAVTFSALWTQFSWKSAHGMSLFSLTKLKEALRDEQSLENIPGRTVR
jgi:hypothetical protein